MKTLMTEFSCCNFRESYEKSLIEVFMCDSAIATCKRSYNMKATYIYRVFTAFVKITTWKLQLQSFHVIIAQNYKL